VLAEALAYAHAQKIFHRDVKPANVLLTYREGPQLLDFNLSHDPDSSEEAEAALRGGTLPYMAPEQLKAFLDPARWADVAEPADIYSLGLLTREMLTGQAPQTPDAALPLPRLIQSLLDRRTDLGPDLRRLNPRVPHALEGILARCLAFEPSDRYADASELAEDLRRYLARRPLRHATNPSFRERGANWWARNRSVLAVAALAAAVAGAAALGRLGPAGARSVEDSPEFGQAVKKLDDRLQAPALDALVRLAPEARHSPVVAFYTAAAYARAERVNEAEADLERAWGLPGAEAALTDWGKRHPNFAGHAENLSATVLNGLRSLDPSRVKPARDLVERTCRLVLRLDPRSYWAQRVLAQIDESKANYAAARTALTQLVGSIVEPESPEGKRRLMYTFQSLARVLTAWGEAELRPAGPGVDLDSAQVHFDEALLKLDLGKKLVSDNDSNSRFMLDYIRCEATLGLAEVAARRGRAREADDLNREAERLLDPLANSSEGFESALKLIREKVANRLGSALAKPEAPPRKDAPQRSE
jgi:hypothetical protein